MPEAREEVGVGSRSSNDGQADLRAGDEPATQPRAVPAIQSSAVPAFLASHHRERLPVSLVWVGEEGAGASRSLSLPRALSGNMAGVEEAPSSGSHLNGDLDPDDREEGAASTAEEAAKKKRRKKKKAKGAATGKGSFTAFHGWPNGSAQARRG